MCGIAGASVYANQIVESFRTSTYTSYTQEMMGEGMNMGMGGVGITTYDAVLLACNYSPYNFHSVCAMPCFLFFLPVTHLAQHCSLAGSEGAFCSLVAS